MPSIDQVHRTAAADEDGGDHLGYETPRSGIATPQPDLQDKRLPGIMSYFGQVRQDPLATQASSSTHRQAASSSSSSFLIHDMADHTPSAVLPLQFPHEGIMSLGDSLSDCHLGQADHDCRQGAVKSGHEASHLSHPYPTPPTSQPPSSGSSIKAERSTSSTEEPSLIPNTTLGVEQDTQARPLAQEEHTLVSLSRASSSSKPSSSTSEAQSGPSSVENPPPASSNKWFTLNGLKGLTRGVFKSGPPTPTRALSTAQSSLSDIRSTPQRTSNDGAEASGTQTPRAPSGVQAPAPKGKLTIKIPEARGLRKCRNPYVVVVFQRSELISGGPRSIDDDESLTIPPPGMGGIPIQRQGSDSGRPPVSIPMRSRQSSNTSISDRNSFQNRTGRLSFTKPKWDAEAVLYVSSHHPLAVEAVN